MHRALLVGLVVACLLFLAGGLHSKPAAAPPGKSSAALLESIQDLLERSAERFERRDFRAANRLLEGGLRILRGVLSERRALVKQIDDVLDRAADEQKGSLRTTMYRDVLVRIQSELSGKPADKKAPAPPEKKSEAFEMSREERTLLELTNRERQKEGLAPLRPNALLFEAARKHSANMARQQKLSHNLDGKGPGDRLRALGYRSRGWAENCAFGSRTPAEAIRGWMRSPGHRKNMLGPSFVEVGLGIAQDEDGVRYWTQVFGVPARR